MGTRDGILPALAIAATAAVAFVAALPWIIQPILRLMLFPRYRLRVKGLEHVPRTGPVVLASNHVSWIDGFILAATCPRRGRVLINADFIDLPVFRSLALRAGLIPVPSSGVRGLRGAIKSAKETLARGEAVGMFPEGQLSRSGLLGPFQRGLEFILENRDDVPVIPVHLDNLWGSIFSYSGGRFFRKRPKGLRHTINIVYGPPVTPPITAFSVRQAVLVAGVRAVELREAAVPRLETIDPELPSLVDPALGPLTGSAGDIVDGLTRQVGHKAGSCGLSLPGVALRVVDDEGNAFGPDAEGRLQALVAGRIEWTDLGRRARIDRDGFVRLSD